MSIFKKNVYFVYLTDRYLRLSNDSFFPSGIVCVACVCALMAFPIAQLVIGLQNQDDCTINKNIPLFLIVSGACGCAAAVLQVFDQMCCSDTDSNGESKFRTFPLI